jgi:hypothetical protein
MSYLGQQAIDYLITQIDGEDSEASSHWRFYHKNFFVNDDRTISGIQGFGGCRPPFRGVQAIVHKALQRKFRLMAQGFPEFARLDDIALNMVEKQIRAYDLDVLRQTITLAFLSHHLKLSQQHSVIAVIGDGFASMATLLLASKLAKYVILVNLNKTLLVDLIYFQKWANHHLDQDINLVTDVDDVQDVILAEKQGGVIALQASNHALLTHFPIDLVINIASMQEMDNNVIDAYFEDMRAISKTKALHFYCCNRKEKKLPDGTLTKIFEYPWCENDQILHDELCSWHQEYYSYRPPFYYPYDGPIHHRLVRMV